MEKIIRTLFDTERLKMIGELRYLFAIEIEVAEDIVGDTFLSATTFWNDRDLPKNPAAWLYTVAKNKTRNYLKKKAVFDKRLTPELKRTPASEQIDVDLTKNVIDDSQLAMIFTICNPCLASDAQIGLGLNLLCGFGIHGIADDFYTSKITLNKRLERAKERLKVNNVRIVPPTVAEINERLTTVLTILYLMFSEGHYSVSQDSVVRENFCTEAMRLNYQLIENPLTNTPAANALLALMCFHASRFPARINTDGVVVPYDEQDETLWDSALIERGKLHLNIAATGTTVSKFHLEAGIAYWHTRKEDTREKWESILTLYNKLLDLEWSPIVALNRTYALAKVNGKTQAMAEAQSLQLTGNLFYQSLLGFLSNKNDLVVNRV